jgi:hypothetical protein
MSDAEALTASARARLEHASAKRASDLMALPPSARLDHLDDNDLIPEHRKALRNSLRSNLAPEARNDKKARLAFFEPLLDRLCRSPAFILIALVASIWLGLAASNSAASLTFDRDIRLRFAHPSGHFDVVYSKGDRIATIGSNALGVHVRAWAPPAGYGIALVDRSVFVETKNSPPPSPDERQ